jgi:hypothetical protein
MHDDPNLLTTEEREQEREALDLVVMGVTAALEILPGESVWRGCFLETRMAVTAALRRRDDVES